METNGKRARGTGGAGTKSAPDEHKVAADAARIHARIARRYSEAYSVEYPRKLVRENRDASEMVRRYGANFACTLIDRAFADADLVAAGIDSLLIVLVYAPELARNALTKQQRDVARALVAEQGNYGARLHRALAVGA